MPQLPPSDLDKKLSAFLKKRQGQKTFRDFAKDTGLPASTLHRLMNGDQSITLGRLSALLKRLKVSLWDVFGDGKK